MTTSLVAIVAGWSDRIKNGRTKHMVVKSIIDEARELEDEVLAEMYPTEIKASEDGIFGEAVDVIASALDIIRLERPNATMAELELEVALYLERKCQKWARKYG